MSTITRFRGDTAADQFTVKRDGAAVDITGCSFKLTVNSEQNPTDTSTQLFSISGVITSAVNGEVDFSPTSLEADQAPGDYFYDIQMTDGTGAKQTIEKGRYRFKQDITKS